MIHNNNISDNVIFIISLTANVIIMYYDNILLLILFQFLNYF